MPALTARGAKLGHSRAGRAGPAPHVRPGAGGHAGLPALTGAAREAATIPVSYTHLDVYKRQTELMLADACGFQGGDIMFSANDVTGDEFALARRLGAYINLDLSLIHI